MKIKQPPKKLSAAIKMALRDLILIEEEKSYVVNINKSWHHEFCHSSDVGFPGVIITKSLKSKDKRSPYVFNYEWRLIFQALNLICKGDVSMALHYFQTGFDDCRHHSFECPDYSTDPELFKNTMCDLAIMLEANNL